MKNALSILGAFVLLIETSFSKEAHTPKQLTNKYGGFYHRFFPDTITSLQDGFIQTKLLIKVGTEEELALIEKISPFVLDSVLDSLNASAKGAMKTRKGRADFRKSTTKYLNQVLEKEIEYKPMVQDVLMTRINIE